MPPGYLTDVHPLISVRFLPFYSVSLIGLFLMFFIKIRELPKGIDQEAPRFSNRIACWFIFHCGISWCFVYSKILKKQVKDVLKIMKKKNGKKGKKGSPECSEESERVASFQVYVGEPLDC